MFHYCQGLLKVLIGKCIILGHLYAFLYTSAQKWFSHVTCTADYKMNIQREGKTVFYCKIAFLRSTCRGLECLIYEICIAYEKVAIKSEGQTFS